MAKASSGLWQEGFDNSRPGVLAGGLGQGAAQGRVWLDKGSQLISSEKCLS